MTIKNYYDIIVVGAGPAGSTAARFASEAGVSVLLLEKDREVGSPVRCGEAVSCTRLKEFIEPDSRWIAAEFNKFCMVAPSEDEALLEFEEKGYVLERRMFDYELARLASSKGTQVLTRAYVCGLISEGSLTTGVEFEKDGQRHKVGCKVVIGADGVESRVGRWAGLKTHVDFRDMGSCIQVTASNIDVNSDTCYLYFGSEVAPEGYLWVFPKGDNKANIGLGIGGNMNRKRSAKSYLDEFMAKKFPEASILSIVSGGDPCTVTLDKITAPGLMLCGDAARQVNPLSGGGIISGMIGGKLAGGIAAESILNKKPEHIFSYEQAWHDRIGKKHEIYDRIKNGIYNFSDEKFNSIAKSFHKVPAEKRNLYNLFKTALFNQPSLLIDIAKVFLHR